MEEILRQIPGVVETEAVYAGGKSAHPTYEDVHTGTTGHAEAVRIVFDPKRLAYADLLEKWFFRMHDPTTRNRQGNDVGTQYRSAILRHVGRAAPRRRAGQGARRRVGQVEEPDRHGDRRRWSGDARRGVPSEVSREESRRLHLPFLA